MPLLKSIRIAILILILWNIPSYFLYFFNPTLGTIASFLTSGLFIVYCIMDHRKESIANPFILFGLLFFPLSAINYDIIDIDNLYVKEFLRFMIVVTFGVVVAKRTNLKELYILLGLGSLSIIINAIVFPEASVVIGRAAGFYLNANAAGAICALGYGISYGISGKKMRLAGQLLFTFAGILTFSRTFLIIWALITIFSIYRDRKNILIPAIGVVAFVLLFSFSEELTLSKDRFKAMKGIVEGGSNRNIRTLQEDSRQDTWAKYYDMILEKPFAGNGLTKFQRKYNGMPGVHNTYLMIIGEAGIIPFLIFVYIYAKLTIKTWLRFKKHPYLFNIILILIVYMLTGHTYLQNFYIVLLSMFVLESLKCMERADNKR